MADRATMVEEQRERIKQSRADAVDVLSDDDTQTIDEVADGEPG